MTKPLVIAHRGGAAVAPENTLSAFERALAIGVDGIEFDLQLTQDGALVVVHDLLQPGEIRPEIPGLAATLDLIATRSPDAIVIVDVKARPWVGADEGPRILDRAAPLLAAYPRPENLVLASFDWGAIEYAAGVLPHHRRAFNTMAHRWLRGLTPQQTGLDDPRDFLAYAEAWHQTHGPGHEALSLLDVIHRAGGSIWSCQHRDLTAPAIARARELGLAVWTWTVNTPADVDRCVDLGVDAVMTDWPDHLLNHLHHGTWSA